MAELKPCPFCGSTDIRPPSPCGQHIDPPPIKTIYSPCYCNNCGATMIAKYSAAEASEAWNTRALDERVKELRERLVKKREAILDRLTDTRPDDSIGDVAAISGRKRGHQDAIDLLDALFPAELKEKEKQDGE